MTTTTIVGNESDGNSILEFAYCGLQGDRDYMEDFHIAKLDLLPRDNVGTSPSDEKECEHRSVSFFAVLDGHGGEIVAKIVSEVLPEKLAEKFMGTNNKEHAVSACLDLEIKDEDVINTFIEVDEKYCSDMYITGTTVTSVFVTKREDYIEIISANVGDSRAIMYYNGQVSALSNDHKPYLPTEKERIEKAGGYVLFMDDMPNNARVNGALAVSRAFGDSMYKHSVPNPYERAVIAVPEINRFKVHLKKEENNECFVVLGSDGVYDVMSNEQIATFVKEKLSEHMPLSDIASALANNCLESEDNISVIIIRLLA